MKKLLVLVLFLLIPAAVSAQTMIGEHIRRFHVDISVQKDASIDVKETIVYDFAALPGKHGIYRYIPYVREEAGGKKYKLEVKLQSVTDDKAASHKYTTAKGDDKIAVKIGDPDKTVNGVVTYVIHYTVKGAVKYYEDHDELYWNLNGFGWTAPIASMSASIILPNPGDRQIQARCFTGQYNSTAQDCTAIVQNEEIAYASTRHLTPGENMTVVAGFPKGVVAIAPAPLIIPFGQTPTGKMVALISAVGALLWYIVFPLYIAYRWYRYGRDPKAPEGVVSAWYSPPKSPQGRELTPGEVGALIDETVQPRDIQAAIVDLARRGYMKIEERSKKDFYFIKGQKSDAKLQGFETELLRGIFEKGNEVRLKDAKLYVTLTKVKKMLYEALVTEGFFPKNPAHVRYWYYALAIGGLVTGNIPVAATAFFFGRAMPVKTLEGAKAAAMGKSLKNFLGTQSRQLEFQAKEQYWFEKLLPYAVAFGVERVWAKRFEGIDLAPPQWYSGYSGGHFTSSSFTNSLRSSMASFATAATPPSSSGSGLSSGGGFSGGGGGGGGGGSW